MSVTIACKCGSLTGNVKSDSSRTIYEFLGVPYAEAPLGKRRFAKPVKCSKWNNILEATKKGPDPPQFVFQKFSGNKSEEKMMPKELKSEDCLHLNIWTTLIPGSPDETKLTKKLLPVVVYIYGGGFVSGSNSLDIYDGTLFSSKENVVFVSINYRVGVFGFLSFGTSEAPGNMGLWDQLCALTWLQENLVYFGGDKNNVTLVGESAGAASISFLMLSTKFASNLFHRVILQSATACNPWAIVSKDEMKRRSIKFASNVLRREVTHLEDLSALASELKLVSTNDLLNGVTDAGGIIPFSWAPIVDGDLLTDHPKALLTTGNFVKCPIIIGHNQNEGTFPLLFFCDLITADEDLNLTEKDFKEGIRKCFQYIPHFPYQTSESGLRAITDHYLKCIKDDHGNLEKQTFLSVLEKAVGEFVFKLGCYTVAKAVASAGFDCFYYVFDYRSDQCQWPKWAGVFHGDEIEYAFGVYLRPDRLSSNSDKWVSSSMLKYWGNFIKFGTPNGLSVPDEDAKLVPWPTYNADGTYLRIGKNLETLKQPHDKQSIEFWTTILPQVEKLPEH